MALREINLTNKEKYVILASKEDNKMFRINVSTENDENIYAIREQLIYETGNQGSIYIKSLIPFKMYIETEGKIKKEELNENIFKNINKRRTLLL